MVVGESTGFAHTTDLSPEGAMTVTDEKVAELRTLSAKLDEASAEAEAA